MQHRKLIDRVTPAPGPVDDPIRPRCGARNKRSGNPCRNWAMKNGRCRLHGGKSTGPKSVESLVGNTYALKHGLYEVGMHPEEKDIYGVVEVGTLTEEIKMVKLLLRRAVRAQFLWEACRGQIARTHNTGVQAAMLESGLWDVEELVTETGVAGFDKDGIPLDIDKTKIIRRKTDFNAEIRHYAKLLEKLENTQRQLQETAGDEDLVARLAEDLRAFTDAASGLMPGGDVE